MSDWSFAFDHRGPRERVLTYEEPGFVLAISLEASGVREYTLVGDDKSLETWTAPAGESIGAAKRQEILRRIESWGASKGHRIGFAAGQSVDEVLTDMRVAGWTPQASSDGQVQYHPPTRTRTGVLTGLWRVCRRVLGL